MVQRPAFAPTPAELDVAVTAGSLVAGLLLFGHISRRFERQADTFAVQHLSVSPPQPYAHDPHISEDLAADVHAATLRRGHEQQAGSQDPVGSSGEQPPTIVTAEAAEAMAGALEAVARLNHIPPARRSWRHGSIRWRQRYLLSLVGKPLDELRIDRVIRRYQIIAIIGAAIVLAFVAIDLFAGARPPMWW